MSQAQKSFYGGGQHIPGQPDTQMAWVPAYSMKRFWAMFVDDSVGLVVCIAFWIFTKDLFWGYVVGITIGWGLNVVVAQGVWGQSLGRVMTGTYLVKRNKRGRDGLPEPIGIPWAALRLLTFMTLFVISLGLVEVLNVVLVMKVEVQQTLPDFMLFTEVLEPVKV